LHGDGDGLQRFQFGGRGVTGAGDLGLEFAVAGGVDVGKGRASGYESLGIGDAFGGAEDLEELIAFAADAAEEARFLEDERPADQRGEQEKAEDAAGDPAGLCKDLEDVADIDGRESKKNVGLLEKAKLCSQKQRSTGVGHGQKD